jgi:hypothetical protein
METVIDADGVKIEPFDTVDEFLARLRRADDITARRRFWFRGVPDATLSLLPSALRVNPSPFKEPVTLATEQLLQEGGALWRFFEAAHYGGLTIPNWSDVEGYLHGRIGHDYERVREFIALAQHHGTPTTLLDWTLDPYVAAYFAATDMDRKYEKAQDMVVWWFDPIYANATGFKAPWTQVRIPFDVNQNARAQRGVFLDYEGARNIGMRPVIRDSLIDFVKRKDAETGSRLIGAFTKFVHPRSLTLQLLTTLRVHHRISASTLFPGYYGAAREERERCMLGDT